MGNVLSTALGQYTQSADGEWGAESTMELSSHSLGWDWPLCSKACIHPSPHPPLLHWALQGSLRGSFLSSEFLHL